MRKIEHVQQLSRCTINHLQELASANSDFCKKAYVNNDMETKRVLVFCLFDFVIQTLKLMFRDTLFSESPPLRRRFHVLG